MQGSFYFRDPYRKLDFLRSGSSTPALSGGPSEARLVRVQYVVVGRHLACHELLPRRRGQGSESIKSNQNYRFELSDIDGLGVDR